MKLASLVAAVLLSGATCFAAELDAPLVQDDLQLISNDSYVIVVRTRAGEIVRLDARNFLVMEIDFVADGTTDGFTENFVGSPYEPTKIAAAEVASVSHEGETYHTFRKIDGSSVRITVDDSTNKVVEISCFAKELSF